MPSKITCLPSCAKRQNLLIKLFLIGFLKQVLTQEMTVVHKLEPLIVKVFISSLLDNYQEKKGQILGSCSF